MKVFKHGLRGQKQQGWIIIDDAWPLLRYKQDELVEWLSPKQEMIGIVFVTQTLGIFGMAGYAIHEWVLGKMAALDPFLGNYATLYGTEVTEIPLHQFGIFPSRTRKQVE